MNSSHVPERTVGPNPQIGLNGIENLIQLETHQKPNFKKKKKKKKLSIVG